MSDQSSGSPYGAEYQQPQARVAQPIPLTQRVPAPNWSAKQERDDRFHRLAASIAQGMLSANGANISSQVLIGKTMELSSALFAEIERKLG